MAKTRRNEPCPCGSGKKFKQCCMTREQTSAAVKERLRAALISNRWEMGSAAMSLVNVEPDAMINLEKASNAVVEMIHAGRLDEAEPAAHQLLKDYPEVHDGYDHFGMINEARGNKQLAASYYRKALDFIRTHPDDYNPELEELFLKLIDELDPASSPT